MTQDINVTIIPTTKMGQKPKISMVTLKEDN